MSMNKDNNKNSIMNSSSLNNNKTKKNDEQYYGEITTITNRKRPMVRSRADDYLGSHQVCSHWGCGVLECYLVEEAEKNVANCRTIPENKPVLEKPNNKTSSSRQVQQQQQQPGPEQETILISDAAYNSLQKDSNCNKNNDQITTVTDDLNDSDSSLSFASSSMEFKTSLLDVTITDNAGNLGCYTGTIDRRTGKPHGEGTMIYDDVIYEGQWVNGDWSGFGRLEYIETSDVYQGGFFDNMKHGLGVIKYADGRIYEGTFQLDCFEGKGHLTFPDGTKYWGNLSSEGLPHGRGKKIFADGRVFDGEFDNDVLQGHGRMTWPDGHWYLGEWSDGKPNGLGLQVLEDGTVEFEGMYSNGQPTVSSCFPHIQKSSGRFLLYRSSNTTGCQNGTLVGPLPEHVYMQNRIMQFAVGPNKDTKQQQ